MPVSSVRYTLTEIYGYFYKLRHAKAMGKTALRKFADVLSTDVIANVASCGAIALAAVSVLRNKKIKE